MNFNRVISPAPSKVNKTITLIDENIRPSIKAIYFHYGIEVQVGDENKHTQIEILSLPFNQRLIYNKTTHLITNIINP